MLFKNQRRSAVTQMWFALAAVLACSVIRPALAENLEDGAFPTCEGTKTATETRYVTTTTTVYSLEASTASETLSTVTTEAATEPASSTREVITVTTVPPAVESTVYVNCSSAPSTSTPIITSTSTTTGTSTTAKPPTPTPTGCVYPSKNQACIPLIKPRNLDIYAALLDGCSIVPKRNTSTKWTGVARASYNRTNSAFRLDIEYAPALVNVTGVTIARGHNDTMAPKLLRLKLNTPRWKPLIYPTSLRISTAPVRLSPAAAEALINGNLYVTVNTARRPVGAIRGQLYCAGPNCALDNTGSLTTPTVYPKFIPTSCNPKNQYGKALTRQKCFACI